MHPLATGHAGASRGDVERPADRSSSCGRPWPESSRHRRRARWAPPCPVQSPSALKAPATPSGSIPSCSASGIAQAGGPPLPSVASSRTAKPRRLYSARFRGSLVSRPVAMISRRTFLHTLSVPLLTIPVAEAQQPGKPARVGYLHPGNYVPTVGARRTTSGLLGLDTMQQGLRDLGWIEGRTVIIETRFAGDQAEKLSGLAMELVQIPVDVLLTVGTAATQAAQKATSTIPIVMYAVGDPVSAGFVASLRRPGGNITGIALN